MDRLERAILLCAGVESEIRAFSESFAEVIEVAGLDTPERDGRVTEILRHVVERPEIRRAFRQGEVVVEEGDHTVRWAVALELDGAGRWWCAWRPFEELREQIVKGSTAAQIKTAGAEVGMLTLRQDGARKVLNLKTTIDEWPADIPGPNPD